MKKELVIFDMDGLMLDSETIAWKAWQNIQGNYNCNCDFQYYKTFIGTNENYICTNMKLKYGNDFPIEKMLLDIKEEKSRIISMNGVQKKQGLIELLEFLKVNNIKRAVATSSSRDVMENLLKITGISSYFDLSVCGNEIENSKPSPDIFLKALEKANVEAKNALVLEDSINGIKAAHNASIDVIFIEDLVTPSEEILDLTYKKMNSLDEVISVL
ncbi:MAG: HAD family phosphatase [Clostridiaceae bacterium]|nr:HAD family phosphatase [Clostridiaceae bacterium]